MSGGASVQPLNAGEGKRSRRTSRGTLAAVLKEQYLRRKDGSMSKRGLWDNIRANKGSGKKPTKEMLEQEKKLKRKKK